MFREERAKQFMAFDALKGLREALEEKEKVTLREHKRELSEEDTQKISVELKKIIKGSKIKVVFYCFGKYESVCGIVEKIDKHGAFISIDENKIFFDDIYEIEITG